MFPNVNGFTWTPVHLAFLGIFFSVTAVIACTVILAALRAKRDMVNGRAAGIQWQSRFHDLPSRDRACRHEISGEFRHRECDRSFDCRGCATHAQLVAARPVAAADDEALYGLRYPADRFYHRGHTWVREESDGTVTIGPDDLSRGMFGRFEQLELPREGSNLELNGTAWKIRRKGDEFRMLSPVEGEVVATGGEDDDFYLKVRPAGGRLETRHLLRGTEIRPWVTRELERLQILLAPDSNAPSLADGGMLAEDAADMYPQVNWPAVWGEMLLEP